MNLNSGVAVNQTGVDFPPLSLDEAESWDEELSPLQEDRFQPLALELSLTPMPQ